MSAKRPEERWKLVAGRQVHGRAIALTLPERLRAARRVPQAVVKVASYVQGVARAGHLLRYISRDGELELETESGEAISGVKEQRALVQDWARAFDLRKKSRDVVHLVYSMPRGSDPQALKRTVRVLLARSFPNHQAVFGVHEDKGHPHAHVAVHMRGREMGKKLRLNRPELYQLRETFAEAAREHGVEMAVSPRAARGITLRRPKLTVFHLRKRKEMVLSDRAMVLDSYEELRGRPAPQRPWEAAVKRRQELERAEYMESTKTLREAALKETGERQKGLLDDALALEQFARKMSPAKTRRELWKEKLAPQFARQKVVSTPDRGEELER